MASDAVDQQLALAAVAAGLSDTTSGTVVSVDWTNRLVVVMVAGAPQAMPWQGAPPWPADQVRVVYSGQRPVCELVEGSPQGTVVSVASNLAIVTGDDGVAYTYPYSSELTLSAGNRVALDHAHRIVSAKYSTEPAGSEAAGPTAPGAGRKSATFRPIDSGNYSNGSFASQYAEISVSRTAAYWYGHQIEDSIPDGATVTKATIALRELWDQVPGAPTEMGTHSQASRGGEPTISGAIDVSGSGTFDIGAFATALKTGSALGIGFRKATGWRRFDTYARSGSIYMEWML